MIKRVGRSCMLFIEISLGLIATAALALGVLWWRLNSGPLPAPFAARHLESELSAARGGRPVTIDEVALVWNRDNRAVELKAFGVRAKDAAGRTLSTSAEVSIGLAPERLLLGRASLSRAHFRGGEVSFVMARDGSTRVALGPPDAPADLVIPPPPPEETVVERANRILDALARTFATGPAARLEAASITDVKIVVVNEAGGAAWTAEGATLAFARDDETLRLAMHGVMRSARGSAPTSLQMTTDAAFQEALIEVGVRDGRLDALAPERLGALRALDAPVTASLAATLDRAKGVRDLELDATVGAGVLRLPDGGARIEGGRVYGRYDLDDDVFVLEELELGGGRMRIAGGGRIANVSTLLAAEGAPATAFEFAFPEVALEAPGVFERPLALADVAARGTLSLRGPAIAIDAASFTIGGARASAVGQLWWERGADYRLRPGVDVRAEITGPLSPAEVLAAWPLKAGRSAREWAQRNVKAGRIEEVRFALRASPEELRRWPVADERLELSFAFAGAEATYLEGMPPITDGVGRGRLRGDSFELALERGSLPGLSLSRGVVSIPQLSPGGGPAVYAARATGEARAMIDVLRTAPFDFDAALPADPESIVGAGVADFAIRRPLGKVAEPAPVAFTVDASLEGVGARSKDGARSVADWRLRLTGDERALTLSGPLRLQGAPLAVSWTQSLEGGVAPSRYVIDGVLDAEQVAEFGIAILPFARGPVGLRLRGAGDGFDLGAAAIELDLTQTEIALVDGFWRKPPGLAAQARFDVERGDAGETRLKGIDVRGADLRASGEALFRADGALLHAALDRLVLGPAADLRLEATRTPAGGLAVDLRGRRLSAAAWLLRDPQGGVDGKAFPKPAGPPQPIELSAAVDELRFQGAASLRNAELRLSTDGTYLRRLGLEGADPGGQRMTLAITPRAEAPAAIAFAAEDAGFAWEALTGQRNIEGGRVQAQGVWTPAAPVQANLTLSMRDFEVVRAPVMAQLFSSMGSLRGMVDMLNGDGIAFTSLEAPLSLANDRLQLGESRMNGPSVGLTVNGAIDLADGRLALDGVLVPSYGVNTFLGSLPLLGELLTSRRGEGVVGMTFSMRGPSDNARVFVNPLSALAPGILRRIFEPFAPAAPQQSARATQNGG